MLNSNYYIAVDRFGDFRIFCDLPMMTKVQIMKDGPEWEDPYGRFHKSEVPSGETYEDWAIPNISLIGGKYNFGKKLKSECIPYFLLDMTHEDKPYKMTKDE